MTVVGLTALQWVDVVLVLVALEAVALVAYRAMTGRGPAVLPFFANLGAGVCLVMALRAALSGGGPVLILMAITGSLVCHLIDLAWRWRR
jgi:hypothetical protein